MLNAQHRISPWFFAGGPAFETAIFFKDRDHLIEKWETLNPYGTRTHFEFGLSRKTDKNQSLTTDSTDCECFKFISAREAATDAKR